MSLADSASLVRNQEFNDRVTVAVVTAALQIAGEQTSSDNGEWSAKRQALAQAVLQSPASQTGRFAWAVAANSTVAAAGVGNPNFDNDVSFVVSSVWDDLAGVLPGEAP